jgi:hypothetical protein
LNYTIKWLTLSDHRSARCAAHRQSIDGPFAQRHSLQRDYANADNLFAKLWITSQEFCCGSLANHWGNSIMLSRAISKRLPGNAAQFSHDLASPVQSEGLSLFSLQGSLRGRWRGNFHRANLVK